MSHLFFMQKAIALSEKARLHSPPNPWVGCVIVKEGEIIGEGYTQPPGQSHAEVCALNQAGKRARGAILYSTLEPCAHTGRTPPCTQALIQAGIKQVFVGIEDPDLRVSGKGIKELKLAGLEVFSSICKEEIETSLAPYLHQRKTGLPFTVLKAAISIDGRVAAADQTSQWMTSLHAREDAHLERAASQAIVIGAGTALKDSPQLTVRHPCCSPLQQPLRVLLDTKGRVPAKGPLFDQKLAPTLVLTTEQVQESRYLEWKETGAEVEILPSSSQGIDLRKAWELLGKRSILQVLVEGGSFLYTALLEAKLVNRLLLYIAPLLLGSSGLSFYHKTIETLQQADRLSLLNVKKLMDCVRLEYQILENL